MLQRLINFVKILFVSTALEKTKLFILRALSLVAPIGQEVDHWRPRIEEDGDLLLVLAHPKRAHVLLII